MTSCPDDRELLELIDGELRPEREAVVVEHLAGCEDCRRGVGRSEAALTYALGGLADSGRWAPDRRRAPVAAAHPAWTRTRLAGIAALALAATLVAAVVLSGDPSPGVGVDPEFALESARKEGPRTELRNLLARAERLRDRADEAPDGRDLLAAGALAAAEVRVWTVGQAAARARVQDVIERFPGTPAAREARAHLASAAWGDLR